MAEGFDRRPEVTDNLRGAVSATPTTRTVPSVPQASTPKVHRSDYASQTADRLGAFAGDLLRKAHAEKAEESDMAGRIAHMQGESFESVQMSGDKYKIDGYRAVMAQAAVSGLLASQAAEIERGGYEASPEEYNAHLVERINALTKDLPDEESRKAAREVLVQQVPRLVDLHTKRNLQFREESAFEALAGSIDTISRDNTVTGELVGFVTGSNPATAGLSVARRRAASTQGIINSFTNNNPAAYAHLDAAGLLTTEHFTASQLSTIRSARSSYESRLRSQFNGKLKQEMTTLNDSVTRGDLDPLVAAEMQADILARHGLSMSATEGNQIYDRARAGVEVAEGTRGLNIRAAGEAGDYVTQAALLQDAVIHQESRGRSDAVSPVGATGIMQVMPATAINPGMGGGVQIDNIFTIAARNGVPFSGHTTAEAKRLLFMPELNKQMGDAYLQGMLREFNGNVEFALAAYNAGPGAVHKYNGIPPYAETQDYVKKIMASINDDRPDPQGARVAAEARLTEVRKQARLDALEEMTPILAENDELFARGERSQEDWSRITRQVYDGWGQQITEGRLNQESQMIRNSVGDRIEELQAQSDNLEATDTAIKLETAKAAAEVRWEARRNALASGEPLIEDGQQITLQTAQEQYVGDMIEAYTQSGAEYSPSVLGEAAGQTIKDSVKVVEQALEAQRRKAIRQNAETANTVGELPKSEQEIALADAKERIQRDTQNMAAANPGVSPVQVAAIAKESYVQYVADNGIVDPQLQQEINNGANGRGWITKDDQPNPRVVSAVHAFTNILSRDPALAYQYVPDPAARGRMLTAAALVQSEFPDRDVFTDVDLADLDDPVANAFHEAVLQVGIADREPMDEDVVQEKLARAADLVDRGNLDNSWFGGWFTDGPTETLTPQRWLPKAAIKAMGSTYTRGDVHAARSIDSEVVDAQYNDAVLEQLELMLPHMPAASTQTAVESALGYVRERGAILGSSFVMANPGEPSVVRQMFPGNNPRHTIEANTAIVNWMSDPAMQKKYPQLRQAAESRSWQWGAGLAHNVGNKTDAAVGRPVDFSVHRDRSGRYILSVPGSSSMILPLREIGEHYISNE